MSQKEGSMYIIGGLPRTGKTTLAEKVSHDLRIGNMETDHIRILFTPTENSPLRPGSSRDIGIVTEKMRPRLECLIESMVSSGTNFVINGECIDPQMVRESPYSKHIRSCFMGLNDPAAAFERIRGVADQKDWATHVPDDELKIILEKYATRSRKLAETCSRLHLNYIDASSDFLGAHSLGYDLLTTPNVEPTDDEYLFVRAV